jgi:signal transduction histidine kinase
LIHRIPGSFKRLLSFVDTMLDYAMSGKTIGTVELVPMDHVLNTVLGDFTHIAEEGIVVFEKMGPMPEVPCDPIKMGQVWQNLVSNAIKYRKGRTPVRIQLGWESSEKTYRFWVHDNGPGIPPEHHQKVFQPFVRLADDVEGSGIGLATVQRVMHAHHGHIAIDANVSEGTKFIFELPRTHTQETSGQ